ncbi:phage antirepressor N-terminal domain-containing protein [Roseomonas mucosa]|uniref:phage antirepressor N-terminal domain-containing protein n=1 Tax=Roseomonas mucosa TaxID=207340 RepID=UPI00384AA04F
MPTELTQVDFHGATLVAIKGTSPETTLVAMKPVVEGMGLNWEKQREKINAHPVLGSAPTIRGVQLPNDTQSREHLFLPLNRLNFWLATVNVNSIAKPEVRQTVIAYQTECADVLFAHFFGKATQALTAQQTGGITKAVIGKAISELVESTIAPLAEQVRTLIIANDARVAVVDFRPMLSALIDAGVEPKRRRALSQRCSKRCIAWLVNSNRGQFIRESRETGRMLFQVDALNDWMKAEGKTLIRAHLDRLAGQTVINFPKKV